VVFHLCSSLSARIAWLAVNILKKPLKARKKGRDAVTVVRACLDLLSDTGDTVADVGLRFGCTDGDSELLDAGRRVIAIDRLPEHLEMARTRALPSRLPL
jgi:hypothetical protein